MNTKKRGEIGETVAVKFLEKRDFVILARNFRTRSGEIDIIAKKGETVSFIEVKTRSSSSLSTPREVVDLHKQRRIISAAKQYISENLIDAYFSFDVIEIIISGTKATAEYFPNAFTL